MIATDDLPCMQVLTTALRFVMAQALVRFHRVAIQAKSKLLTWANEACCVAGLRAIRDERCAGESGAGAVAGVDLLWARSALLLVCAHLPYDDAMAPKALQEASRRLHRLRGAGTDAPGTAPGTAPVEVWEHLGASCAAARCVLLEASAVLVQLALRRPSAVRVRPFVATLDATLAICTKARDAEATGAVVSATAPSPSPASSLAADDAAVARRGFTLLRGLLSAVPPREYAVDGGLLEVLSTTLAHHVRHGMPELCLEALQVR